MARVSAIVQIGFFALENERCPPFPFEMDDGWPPPRILTFADIISEAEIAALLAAQNEEAFQQSKDQGDYDSFGISEVGLILRLHSVSLQ